MPTTPPGNARVSSSPASSGNAGPSFEQHVAANWLAWLLVRGIPPILLDCTVIEVHFQTEHLGWNADDFLVIGEAADGIRRHLVGQVKRSFTVSAGDIDCKGTITDCWKDFHHGGKFDPALDRFVIVTLRGTNTLLEYFAGLLECARASQDAKDFEHRLGTRGFVHAKVVEYCNDIRAIVGEYEGHTLTVLEIWPFLKVLHVLSLDLTTSTGQAESLIKSLLAYTSSETNPQGAADATWNALVRMATEDIPRARSYQYGALPEALRQRHTPISGQDHRSLAALRDHSSAIIGGVRTTIGPSLQLPRTQLLQTVLNRLETSQVVVITGAAGSGKSVVATSVLRQLGVDHFTFCFRAEEFAQPHFDATLLLAQIPLRATALCAILAGQNRKILLIESVERLLEASTRDAFRDLLTLVRGDPGWRLLLTCRDYSTDLVRTSFLESAGVAHTVVTITPLNDTEQDRVATAYPQINPALGSAPLRELLRNPYTLGLAVRMPWQTGQQLPTSERGFRSRFWQEIVRADHQTRDGMPSRREQIFVEIALRRARALTLYANCEDLDPIVIDRLRLDSLVLARPQTLTQLAPAHDVLEDWAILHWIDGQHAIHQESIENLAETLGTHPSVRRTYRKWVGELVAHDPAGADELFQAVLKRGTLPGHFRDDTLVALLRSADVGQFLTRHREVFFREDNNLLRRIIFLLRVGCVKTPEWLGTSTPVASIMAVPDGQAWACVLQLAAEHLEAFGTEESFLLLGFIEDWSRGVSLQFHYPDGATAAAAIAYHLLPHFGGYRSEEGRKQTLQVIAKIPLANRDRFTALLTGRSEDREEQRACRELQEIIFSGPEGTAVCRDMPELVVEVAHRQFPYRQKKDDRHTFGGSVDVKAVFGLSVAPRFDLMPASAYRGPFLLLLQHHPLVGIDFILWLANHSAEWYGHRKIPSSTVELPAEITLTFADGSYQKQWCNGRLWNLYRGTSVGPYLLQSAIMALEYYLFSVKQAQSKDLDTLLVGLLRRSRSAAISAVVASVASAYPHLAGEAILVLLSAPACILLDRARRDVECSPSSLLYKIIPQLDATKRVFDEERKQSDALRHRQSALETAVVNLQSGPLGARVQELLDRHRAALPPVAEQDESCRLWRLALHGMDIRRHRVAREQALPSSSESGEVQPPRDRPIRVEIDVPEPELREMISQSAAEHEAMNTRSNIFMWGLKVFRREDTHQYDTKEWRQWLRAARDGTTTPTADRTWLPGEGGPGFVAAVCIRDHWNELTAEEGEWCTERVCGEIERYSDDWHFISRMQQGGMSGDRPAAWILSALLGHTLTSSLVQRVQEAFLLALTHSNDEVRGFAASGIGANLWNVDRNLALQCINTLAIEATMIQFAHDSQRGIPYQSRRQPEEIEPEVAATVRRLFVQPSEIPDDAYLTFDPTRWCGSKALLRLLVIAESAADDPVALTLYQRASHTLVEWWDSDDDRREEGGKARERPDHIDVHLTELLVRFLSRAKPATLSSLLNPMLDAIDRHPRQISWIIQGLMEREDRCKNPSSFWPVWSEFADRIRRAEWLEHIDDEHAAGAAVMSAIFFGLQWKDNVRHWESLEGYSHHVHSLFDDLPASSAVLENYVRFLYHIGEQSLPEAFIRIAKRLVNGDSGLLLGRSNTRFMLETLLRRYVYTRPLELKKRSDLRNAVLSLLDLLVDNGSSAAFRMRDDFVTPVAAS